jgi:hypothetical protein
MEFIGKILSVIAFASIITNTGSSPSLSFCWTIPILDHGPRTAEKKFRVTNKARKI